MAIRRMTAFGCLALFCGLALLGNALLGAPSVSRAELARTFGGDCQECKRTRGCGSKECEDVDEGSSKITGTNQSTASCNSIKTGGAKNCVPNTPKECTTTTSCDGPGCAFNCSDEVAPTNTNCLFSGGPCAASP